jgi:hypothetical protein
MTYEISAIEDQYFTGENAKHSRGFMAVYRRVGAAKWTICKDWVADGHGSGFNATVWGNTREAAKEAAKQWLRKQLKKKRGA